MIESCWHTESFSDGSVLAQAAQPPRLRRRRSAVYAERIIRACADTPNPDACEVVCGDARDLAEVDDESVALVVTSPPYWNKANYGDGEFNVGNIPNYTAFIESLRGAWAECFRVLSPGRKLCIVTANVNQHTDHGLLTFPIAADIINLVRDLGFVLVNEIIWSKDGTGGKWGSWGEQRPIFGSYPYPPNFLFKNVHEYIIIAAKPPARLSRSKTALPYAELVGPPGGYS